MGAADHTLSAPCSSVICSRAARQLVSEFPHLVFHYCSSSEPCSRGHLEREYYHLTFEGKVFLSPSLFTLSPALLLPHIQHVAERTPAAEPAQLSLSKYSSPANQLPRTRCTLERSCPWRRCRSNFREQSETPGQQRRWPGPGLCSPNEHLAGTTLLITPGLEREALWHPNWENRSS